MHATYDFIMAVKFYLRYILLFTSLYKMLFRPKKAIRCCKDHFSCILGAIGFCKDTSGLLFLFIMSPNDIDGIDVRTNTH